MKATGKISSYLLPLLLIASSLALVTAAPSTGATVEARAHGCSSDADCPSSRYCSASRNRCFTKLPDNARCSRNGACVSGSCVDRRCQGAPLANGADCRSSKQCISGNCENSICSPKKADGASCYKPANCISGVCTGGKCGTPTTTPPTVPPTVPPTGPLLSTVARDYCSDNDCTVKDVTSKSVTVTYQAVNAQSRLGLTSSFRAPCEGSMVAELVGGTGAGTQQSPQGQSGDFVRSSISNVFSGATYEVIVGGTGQSLFFDGSSQGGAPNGGDGLASAGGGGSTSIGLVSQPPLVVAAGAGGNGINAGAQSGIFATYIAGPNGEAAVLVGAGGGGGGRQGGAAGATAGAPGSYGKSFGQTIIAADAQAYSSGAIAVIKYTCN